VAITIDGTHFKDDQGRTLILRGSNLDAKLPGSPDGSTHILDRFFDAGPVSFVGKPFPLGEADEHFSRLKRWGLNFLRFPVSWEGIEHSGPGIYDNEYLDYIFEIVKKAGEHGMLLYIDPHQDVWSRFSGGDGAPAWTFDIIGMDITAFQVTGAAVIHQACGDDYLPQVWSTNAHKLAAATMYTLFFGGNVFAPKTKVAGVPVQEYLQQHYIDALKQVAMKLKGLPHVLGYETMNEPWKGYIDCADLNSMAWHEYKNGDCPTAFQGILLGSGIPQEVEVWRAFLPKLIQKRIMNAEGVRVWKTGFDCVWKANGVWDFDHAGKPVLLQPDYFTKVNGQKVNLVRDHIRPFFNRYAEGIRSIDPGAIIFLTPPNDEYDLRPWSTTDAANTVYKPHWYEGIHWISKSYVPWLHAFLGYDRITKKIIAGTPRMIQRSFNGQMRHLKEIGTKLGTGMPTVIGETGICFDMNKKEAYRTGDYKYHVKVWDRIFRALDANLLNYNLWTYSAINDIAYGDHWNLEDFSIFGRDQQTDPDDPHSGGRALKAIVRPYPKAVAGEPLHISFDINRRIFKFEFRYDTAIMAPTEIFVPDFQFPDGYKVEVSDGSYEKDAANQLLIYTPDSGRALHSVKVIPVKK
jgi:hypothetical protein